MNDCASAQHLLYFNVSTLALAIHVVAFNKVHIRVAYCKKQLSQVFARGLVVHSFHQIQVILMSKLLL